MGLDGHIFGMIYDKRNEERITNAKVSWQDNDLVILMPGSKGIYFACGKPKTYKITVSAGNYTAKDLDLNITSGSFYRRDIFL